jgi:Flp pilus assembly protein TadB
MSNKEVVVSAPMSFSGSLARTKNWMWHDLPVAYKVSVGWLAVFTTVTMWWTLIFVWYLFFGLLLAPYRLVRRGSRKRKNEAKKHAEMMEALKANRS